MPNIEIEATEWIKDIQEFNIKTENIEDVGSYEYELADKCLEEMVEEINVLVRRYNEKTMADGHRQFMNLYQQEYCDAIGDLVACKLKNKDYKVSKIEALDSFLHMKFKVKSVGLSCSISVEKPLTQDERLEKFEKDFNAGLLQAAVNQ